MTKTQHIFSSRYDHYLPQCDLICMAVFRQSPKYVLLLCTYTPKLTKKYSDNNSQGYTKAPWSLYPDAPCIILVDFNHCNLKSMRSFYQYILPSQTYVVQSQVHISLWLSPLSALFHSQHYLSYPNLQTTP